MVAGWLAVLAACTSAGAEPTTPSDTVATTVGDPTGDSGIDASTDTLTPDGTDAAVDDESSVDHPDVRTRADGLEEAGVQPQGVGTVTARVTSVDGEVCDVCLWLAAEAQQRSSGLMGVTDLGEPVGMAFVWDAPTSGNFFMFNTPTPLSIAWFTPAGAFLAAADMDPCLSDTSAACERYGPGGDYDLAIEMFSGQLGVIGIGPGSTVELLPGTDSPTCLVTR